MSYRRECLIDLNKYHYLVCGCVVFHCGRTDVRTHGRTFLPGLLGHLSGDDLKNLAKFGSVVFEFRERTDAGGEAIRRTAAGGDMLLSHSLYVGYGMAGVQSTL